MDPFPQLSTDMADQGDPDPCDSPPLILSPVLKPCSDPPSPKPLQGEEEEGEEEEEEEEAGPFSLSEPAKQGSELDSTGPSSLPPSFSSDAHDTIDLTSQSPASQMESFPSHEEQESEQKGFDTPAECPAPVSSPPSDHACNNPHELQEPPTPQQGKTQKYVRIQGSFFFFEQRKFLLCFCFCFCFLIKKLMLSSSLKS